MFIHGKYWIFLRCFLHCRQQQGNGNRHWRLTNINDVILGRTHVYKYFRMDFSGSQKYSYHIEACKRINFREDPNYITLILTRRVSLVEQEPFLFISVFCGDQVALSLVFYMFLLLSFFFVLSVLLLFTVSSYPFGIFKFFWNSTRYISFGDSKWTAIICPFISMVTSYGSLSQKQALVKWEFTLPNWKIVFENENELVKICPFF